LVNVNLQIPPIWLKFGEESPSVDGFSSLARSASVLQRLKRRYNQQLYPIRGPNPERSILGPLSAKQRHSGKGIQPEPELSRAERRNVWMRPSRRIMSQ